MTAVERALVLVHAESDGTLAASAREALAAGAELARGLGIPFDLGVSGPGAAAAAARFSGCGAARCLAVEGAEFGASRYATDAAAAVALARAAAATLVFAPHTARFARVLAGVAHRLGGRSDAHVTGLAIAEGKPRAVRWLYRQRLEAEFTRSGRPWIIGLEPGVRPPASEAAGGPAVEPVAVAAPALRTRVEGVVSPPADEQTIRPDAPLLLVAGAGWTKKQADGRTHADDAARLILGCLRASRASLGSSKSLVEQAGEGSSVLPFLSHLNQVGQTGATPRHPKGLATCCHGEEPHVVGWRFIGERRAINLDAGCGWAQGKADVLYVADAFAVLDRLNVLLGDR